MIRRAAPDDASAIRSIHEAAFPTSLEADLVEALIADGDAAISLVAVEGDSIAGHVMLSRMAVEADGRPWRSLGLGPIGVLPEAQRRGVGAALIERALEIAREEGEVFVFLLGEPAYYARFGFSAGAAMPFASPYAGPYFMAITLRNDIPRVTAGEAAYAPAFAGLGEAA